MTLVAILVLPLLASILCWTPAVGRKAVSALTMLSSLALLGLSVFATQQVIAHGRVVAIPGWIEMDALGALILLLVTAVGVTALRFHSSAAYELNARKFFCAPWLTT